MDHAIRSPKQRSAPKARFEKWAHLVVAAREAEKAALEQRRFLAWAGVL